LAASSGSVARWLTYEMSWTIVRLDGHSVSRGQSALNTRGCAARRPAATLAATS